VARRCAGAQAVSAFRASRPYNTAEVRGREWLDRWASCSSLACALVRARARVIALARGLSFEFVCAPPPESRFLGRGALLQRACSSACSSLTSSSHARAIVRSAYRLAAPYSAEGATTTKNARTGTQSSSGQASKQASARAVLPHIRAKCGCVSSLVIDDVQRLKRAAEPTANHSKRTIPWPHAGRQAGRQAARSKKSVRVTTKSTMVDHQPASVQSHHERAPAARLESTLPQTPALPAWRRRPASSQDVALLLIVRPQRRAATTPPFGPSGARAHRAPPAFHSVVLSTRRPSDLKSLAARHTRKPAPFLPFLKQQTQKCSRAPLLHCHRRGCATLRRRVSG